MISKKEFSFITFVLIALIGVTIANLFVSYRKSRDNERKNSLGDIVHRVGEFQKATGTYPLSVNDNIQGCDGFRDKLNRWFFKECAWDKNPVNSPYFDPLPHDPYVEKGRKFVYRSNGTHFQLYAALEGTGEDEFDENIVKLQISCGDVVCNAGRTNGEKSVLYSPLPSPVPTL